MKKKVLRWDDETYCGFCWAKSILKRKIQWKSIDVCWVCLLAIMAWDTN